MKDFNIKDLLIHVLHGGIILFVIYLSLSDACIEKIEGTLGLFDNLFGATFLIVLSYLIGLVFVDPLADWLDTKSGKDKYKFMIGKHKLFEIKNKCKFWDIIPSYYLLRYGKCKNKRIRKCECQDKSKCECNCKCDEDECNCDGLRFAHYAKVRDILCKDVKANDKFIQEKEKREIKKGETDIWKDRKKAMLLFNYAKNRAFAYGTTYQLERVEAYYRLFIFYRNMVVTTLLSLMIGLIITPLLSCCWCWCCCCCWRWGLILVAGSVLARICCKISYKYRTYYCRMVLGAVYSPPKENSAQGSSSVTCTCTARSCLS